MRGSGEHDPGFAREPAVLAERDRTMRDIFARLSPHYDLLCDLQSLGMHRYWRRVLAWLVAPRPGERLLDVAGGSGEAAVRLAGPELDVVVLDASLPMMQVGRRRGASGVAWVAGLARALPFPDDSMDAVTIAFGLRNVASVEAALSEIVRVLRPGGRFLSLEVSQPVRVLRPLHHLYSRYAVPALGALITRDPEAFGYLAQSIVGFPDAAQIKRLMERAGFVQVRYHPLSLGVASIHAGMKP